MKLSYNFLLVKMFTIQLSFIVYYNTPILCIGQTKIYDSCILN